MQRSTGSDSFENLEDDQRPFLTFFRPVLIGIGRLAISAIKLPGIETIDFGAVGAALFPVGTEAGPTVRLSSKFWPFAAAPAVRVGLRVPEPGVTTDQPGS
jgi:hypothetical protein